MKKIGIYAFVNLIDGSRYVGQSKDIDKRKSDHLSMLRRGRHSNARFQRAFSRDGESSFAFIVLCLCKSDELNDAEQYYLGDMRGLYNFSPLAQANAAGKRSEETRVRISEGVRKSFNGNPDRAKKHGEIMRAIFRDEDRRKKFAGFIGANTGRKYSDAEKLARSIRVKASKSTDEHRALVSANAKRVWADPLFRERHAASMREAIDADVLKKRNESIKRAKSEKFADPDYRAAISKKLKAAWARRKQAQIKEPNK